jgi:hypothetical protein
LITVRRTLGIAFLAGGAALAARGFDYRDEADGFYDDYELATDEAEIEKLYQRTTNRDVKSQVSWALAAAFGITGLRLVFTGGDGGYIDTSRSRSGNHLAAPTLSLTPAVGPQTVGLRLQRRFH